jgi:predicted transcriptional regulator
MSKDTPFPHQTTPPATQLARLLRDRRRWWHISQAELAHRAGTTQRIVAQIETVTYNPSLELTQRLFDALEYDIILQIRPKLRGK